MTTVCNHRGSQRSPQCPSFGFAKNCGFWFGFGFTKLTAVSVFYGSVFTFFCRRLFYLCLYGMTLEMTYFCSALVQLIVSWSDSELDVQRYGMKKYFNCWSYHVGRWTVNETTWKTVPKPRQSVFLKTEMRKLSSWIFRSVISVQFLENRYPTFSSGSAHPYFYASYLLLTYASSARRDVVDNGADEGFADFQQWKRRHFAFEKNNSGSASRCGW